jgi:hypothetical protein
MWDVAAVVVNPDDLAFVVDAQGVGAFCAEGIVERGVGHVCTPLDENFFQFTLGANPGHGPSQWTGTRSPETSRGFATSNVQVNE